MPDICLIYTPYVPLFVTRLSMMGKEAIELDYTVKDFHPLAHFRPRHCLVVNKAGSFYREDLVRNFIVDAALWFHERGYKPHIDYYVDVGTDQIYVREMTALVAFKLEFGGYCDYTCRKKD